MSAQPARRPRRRGARRPWIAGSLGAAAALALVTAGCTSRTHVELDSARGPLVQPVDAGDGPDGATVVDAGVTAIDDETVDRTTAPDAADDSPFETVDPADVTTSTVGPAATSEADAAAEALLEICRAERRRIKALVDNYRADSGEVPTSEFDLIASAYMPSPSELFDVWADGTVVPQGSTCAASN